MSETDLPASRLGTKEHWDNVYASELANFEEIGDEGEIWFGEDSVEKMVDWVLDSMPPSTEPPPSILEIGAGNGTLLFALHDAGYAPDRMYGVDYSADAVKLAQAIGRSRQERCEDGDPTELKAGPAAITFAACDFLNDPVPFSPYTASTESGTSAAWDLVLDKGTFDAMVLAQKDDDGRSHADTYPSRVADIVKPGGYFLITSCNFTEDELKAKFTNDTGLSYHSRIPFPTFSFGGKSGNVYSSVAFQKPA
ncbi:S-adenosyl-L-methionine-dependent methyltransferase [Obba rivulosa]|uniref:Protein-lysine N-methyltransferase EFM4 n=1 Tax=Obba rivulosa TaxID=1052685 RepID=A0A8E2DRD0_9APHY|nr:S-adenosyl-L-methionine-dependent methyltransferase [Obba rivulosa]